jgi:hypothetical protein
MDVIVSDISLMAHAIVAPFFNYPNVATHVNCAENPVGVNGLQISACMIDRPRIQ